MSDETQPHHARLPERGRPWEELRDAIQGLRRDDLDWRHGRHSALIWYADDDVERVSSEAFGMFLVENGLGLRFFPSPRRMEDVVAIGRELLGGDDGVCGHMTSGGTESLFLAAHAAHAAREWARRRQPTVVRPEVVVPGSAHPAIDKAAHYLGMDVVRVPVRANFRADSVAMEAAITPATVMLCASAPTYSLGVVDPIAQVGEVAARHGLWFHVDACVGGILAPFAREIGVAVPAFAFDVPGVTSVSADLHKSGFTPKGASTVLFRSAERQEVGVFHFDGWPSGRYSTRTFTGTRPGGAIAASWAILNFLGREGYRRIAGTVMATRARLLAGLAAIGGVHVWGDPELWALGYGLEGGDIFAVADRLESQSWHVARIREPRGIHLMITPVHARSVDEYLVAVADAARQVRATGERSAVDAVYWS